MRSRAILLAAFAGVASSLAAQNTVATAAVHGKVSGPSGIPLDSVTIEIVGVARTRTDSAGIYELYPIPAGVFVVHATKLGYRQALKVVTTRADEELFVPIALEPLGTELPRIIVREDSTPSLRSDPSGFDIRRRSGMGRYITAGDIEKKHLSRTVDALRAVPGVEVDANGVVNIHRGEISVLKVCPGAQILVNGVAMPPPAGKDRRFTTSLAFSPDEIPIESIKGIEVYSGAATTPAVLRTEGTVCGTVAIWTK